MRSCFDIAAAGSAKSKFGSFSALILHKIQKNGVKDQLEIKKPAIVSMAGLTNSF
jgi:hypothetical protein